MLRKCAPSAPADAAWRRGSPRRAVICAVNIVRFWHKADVRGAAVDVRHWWGKSGHCPNARRCRLLTQSGHQHTGRCSATKLLTKDLPRISPSSRGCCAKLKIGAAQWLSLGVVRKRDQGRKTGAAFWAMPNVTRVVVAPVLGPHRRNQVSTALNAMHDVNLLTNMNRFRRQPRKA